MVMMRLLFEFFLYLHVNYNVIRLRYAFSFAFTCQLYCTILYSTILPNIFICILFAYMS